MTATLTKQSTLSVLELPVLKEELEAKFNAYWNFTKNDLHPDLVAKALKGGYREVTMNRAVAAAGGKSEFFKPVLAHVIQEYFQGQPEQPLSINSVSMRETVQNYLVKAEVYMEPQVVWKGPVPGIDTEFKVDLPKIEDNYVDVLLENEINSVLHSNTELVAVPQDIILRDGMVVGANIKSVFDDGQLYLPGTFDYNKWYLVKDTFKIEDIYNNLIGMKIGDTKDIKIVITSDIDPAFVDNKNCTISVKIVDAFNMVLPTLDDEFAKKQGFTDKADMTAKIKDKISAHLADQVEIMTSTAIARTLFNSEVVNVEPIPSVWMHHKAKDIYFNLRRTKDDDQLINELRGQKLLNGSEIKTRQNIIEFLAEKSAQALIEDLVYRAWGIKKGVKGDHSLGNISEYVNAVKTEIKSLMVVNYVDINKEN